MQITVPHKYIQKLSQLSLVGSEVKNPLPSEVNIYPDTMGLSCLVIDDSSDYA